MAQEREYTRAYIDFTKPAKSKEQALESLRMSCARAERAPSDVRRSMLRWRMDSVDIEQIMQSLVSDGFVDESRYAASYVREKISLGSWGRVKIEHGLRAKSISREAIAMAMEQVEPQRQSDQLEQILRRRYERERPRVENNYALTSRLIRWAMGRGYDYEQIRSVLGRITKEDIEEW